MEQSVNLDSESIPPSAALVRGVIHRLKHLSAGTDIRSTHLVSAHNGVGYGYIRTPEGEVFFDASAVMNVRFDRLIRGMTVEFALEHAPYLRTSHITVVAGIPVKHPVKSKQTMLTKANRVSNET